MSKSSIDYSELAGLAIAMSRLSTKAILTTDDKVVYKWLEHRVQTLKKK